MKQFAYVAQLPSHWLNSSGCAGASAAAAATALLLLML